MNKVFTKKKLMEVEQVVAHSSAADAHARSSMQCLATKKITVIYEKGEFDG